MASTSSRLLFVCILVTAGSAQAQIPTLIHQEGLIVDAQGSALAGPVDLRFSLYAAEMNDNRAIWTEAHADVPLFDGYYSVLLGGQAALTGDVVVRAPWLGLGIDGAAELQPRRRFASVPYALVAGEVRGLVNATRVLVAGNVVIDDRGRWVGDPTGLVGPAGPQGAAGPQGPAGPAGGAGSPDTPAQILAKLVQVDGANSTLDADRLDGLDSAQLVRSDVNSGVARDFQVGGALTVIGSGSIDGNWDLRNHNLVDANRVQIGDPGPDGRLEWIGTEASIYVATLADGNADGWLRIVNDGGISLESNVRVTGLVELAEAGLRQGATQLIDGRGRWLGGLRPQRCPQGQSMVGLDASGDIVCEVPAPPAPPSCGGGARRVGENEFADVGLINFDEVAGPGCTVRNGNCPECRRVGAFYRNQGVVYDDATWNVATGYARSNQFGINNGPCSGWGNQPSEFRLVVPGTDNAGVVSRVGFYTTGLAACNPLRVELFDVAGNRIADFRDVPCGEQIVPARWYGFMGVGNIHRVRVSGANYAIDDLRVPSPVAPNDPGACR